MDSAMFVAGEHGGFPVAPMGAAYKRKWRGKGAKSNQRYRKNHKAEKGQGQGQGYDPPRLKDLQKQNRLKTRKYYAKKRMSVPRTVPRAPFNDSSFLMRVRRSGGLESIVSPAPSSFFSSPACSSYKLGVNDSCMNHEDYGYGSMTGLIHLRPTEDDQSSDSTVDNNHDDICVEQPSISTADSVEQLEQRLDFDISRFEMTYPLPDRDSNNLLEERVTRQDSHIADLEDENLTLKERLFLMQQEVNELRQRLQGDQSCKVDENADVFSDHGGIDQQ